MSARKVAKIGIKWLVYAIFCLTALPVLVALRPLVQVRFGIFFNQRIGHLALNTEIFLRRRQISSGSKREVFIFTIWDPANRQLAKMYKRHLTIIENRLVARLHWILKPLLIATGFQQDLPMHKHERYHIINAGTATLQFSREEEMKGRGLLEKMGIPDDGWFVAFNSRDLSYLNDWRPEQNETHWRTAFRNNLIAPYMKAAEFVTSQGGYAVRVGSVVSEALPDHDNPRIIDYSKNFRSDFGDIYVGAKSSFFLGPNTGLSFIQMAFDQLVGWGRVMPLCKFPYHTKDLFTPALLTNRRSNQFESFSNLKKLGFFEETLDLASGEQVSSSIAFGRHCDENNLEIADDDPDNIVDLCKDLLDQVKGISLDKDISEMQTYFRREFLETNGEPLSGGKIAPRFCRKYQSIIMP